MNEAQTREDLINPAIRAAGWTAANGCRMLVEQNACEFAPGRVGKVRGKPLRADYILTHRGRRLAVVEAKSDEHQAIEGYEQALKYGRMLGVLIAYATNGREILEIDLETGGVTRVERFPTPQELWSFVGLNGGKGWMESFSCEPFWTSADKRPRYYQELAVTRVLDAVAEAPGVCKVETRVSVLSSPAVVVETVSAPLGWSSTEKRPGSTVSTGVPQPGWEGSPS